METSRDRYRYATFLTFVIVGGLLLRLWGIGYGLPHIYFTDEAAIINQTLAMGYTHSLKPHGYGYPSGMMYVLGVLYAIYYLLGFLFGYARSTHDFAISMLRDPSALYLIARSVSVLAGIGTIVVVYLVGKSMFDRRAGLVASGATAFAYMLIFLSHFVKLESLETFLVLLAFAWALRASNSGKGFHYALAGIFVGFTAAVKYNGGLVILSVLILSIRSANWKQNCKNVLTLFVSSALGFFILMPYAILDWKNFFSDVTQVAGFFKILRIGQVESLGQWWGISVSWLGFGLTVLYLCGILYAVGRPNRNAFALAIFPIMHFTFFNLSSLWRNPHWQAPIIPFLALAGGAFSSWLWKRWTSKSTHFILTLLLLAAIAESGFLASRRNFLMSQPDTRTLALEWIEKNVPPHSVLVMDHGQFLPGQAPPVRQTPLSIDRNYLGDGRVSGWQYRDRRVYFELLKEANQEPLYEVYPILHDDFGGKSGFWNRPAAQSLDWYRSKEASYAVLAGYERKYKDPKVQMEFRDYVKPYLAFYDSVLKEGRLLAEFLPHGRLGPELRVYCIAESCMGT